MSLPVQLAADDPSQRMLALQRMDDDLKLIHTLLGGTRSMREAGSEYLPLHPNESHAAHTSRLEKAVLLNVLEDSIDNCVSRVFEEEMRLSEEAPELLLEWVDNIDLEGTNLHDFGRKVMRYGLEDGIVHVLADFPRIPSTRDEAGNFVLPTLAEERALGLRPYLSVIRQQALIAAYFERVGGESICTHLRFKVTETTRDGFAEREVERIHVLEPGYFAIYEQRTHEDQKTGQSTTVWEMVEEGELRKSATELWDRVPFYTYIASNAKKGPVEVKPPFQDLAYLNVRHWQSTADQQNILDHARFPMLAVSGFQGPIRTPVQDDEGTPTLVEHAPFTVGPRTVLTTSDPAGKWYYVEHTGSAIEAGSEELERLEDQMRVSGVDPLLPKGPGDQTATERSIDESKARAPLEVWARNLGNFMENAIEGMAEWVGADIEVTVHVNTEVGLGVGDATEMQNIIQLRAMGEISRWTLYQEMMRRGLLGPNFDPRLETMRMALENPDDPQSIDEGEVEDETEETDDPKQVEAKRQRKKRKPVDPEELDDPAPRKKKSNQKAKSRSKRRAEARRRRQRNRSGGSAETGATLQ